MIDIFVMVVTLAAFKHNLLMPRALADVLPPNFPVIDLTVRPVWGLYSNTLAQVVTQLISHWIIYLHRNACAAAAHEDFEASLNVATQRLQQKPPAPSATKGGAGMGTPGQLFSAEL